MTGLEPVTVLMGLSTALATELHQLLLVTSSLGAFEDTHSLTT